MMGCNRTTPRDEAVLCEVFSMRLAVSSQILALCPFGSIGRCRARVRALRENGLLRSIPLTGPGRPVFACAPKAAPIVSRMLGIPLDEARRACRKGPSLAQAEHAFAVSEFRILLGQGGPETAWLSERQCTHAYEAYRHGAWRKRLVRPDGFFRVRGVPPDCFFVEMDLGTVSIPRIRRKLEEYALYLDEAFGDAYGEDGFSVLVATTTRARLDRIRSVTAGRPKVLLATMGELAETGVWSDGAWTDASGAKCAIREAAR